MRLRFAMLLLLTAPSGAAFAQERVVRPGGAAPAAVLSRQCMRAKIEMVEARVAPESGDANVPAEYLDRVAKAVFFYFNPPEVRNPRRATIQVAVRPDGSVSSTVFLKFSELVYFDREVKRAVLEAGQGKAFAPLPAGFTGDSLNLVLAFGERANDKRPYLEKRTVCSVLPSPTNPAPTYPSEMRDQSVRGFVRARFVVDTIGHIKLDTFEVVESSNESFTRAVRNILPRLTYLPAEVQGRKVEQLTEQIFRFDFAERPMR